MDLVCTIRFGSILITLTDEAEPSSDIKRVIPIFCPTNAIAIFLILSILIS